MPLDYKIDCKLDFGGDSFKAQNSVNKRGFTSSLIEETNISFEAQMEFIEKNDLSYALVKNLFEKNDEKIYLKKDGVQKYFVWARSINNAVTLDGWLKDGKFLKKAGLEKNCLEVIRKVSLKSTVEISASTKSAFHGTYLNDYEIKKIKKFILAVLASYKSNAKVEIKSSKDFKKLIGLTENKEKVIVKFFDEAQAAEFILMHGDTFPIK